MTKLNTLLATYRQQPRWMRIALWLTTIYLLYALLIGLLTPAILKAKLPDALSESLGRQVSVEDITINPFLLRARLQNFRIAEAGTNEDFFRFSQLEVDIGFWQSLLTFTPSVEHLFLTGPYVQLHREHGGEHTRFNFSDIIEHLQNNAVEQSTPSRNDEAENTLPHIRLGLLRLTSGMVLVVDKVTGADLAYPDLAFELANLDTQATIPVGANREQYGTPDNVYQIDVTTNDGGTLHLDGLFQLSPLAVSGTVALNAISLPPLWPLSDDVINAKLTSGRVDLSVQYQLAESPQGLAFSANHGQLALTSLVLSDADKTMISINGITVEGIKLDSASARMDIASLQIDAPYVSGVYSQSGLDVITQLTPAGQSDTEQAPVTPAKNSNESGWHLVLGGLTLNKGDIQLQETALADNMFWRVYPLNFSTGEIDTRFTTPIDYDLALSISGNPQRVSDESQGEISIKGQADVAAQSVTGDLSVVNIGLSQLQSYLVPYVNVTLSDGLLSTSGVYEANGDGQAAFTGQAAIENLTILDGLHNEPLLKWQAMKVDDIGFSTTKNQLTIATISLDKPYAKLLIDEQKRSNIGAILQDNNAKKAETDEPVTQTAQAEMPAPGDEAPLDIRIEAININQGSAYFADASLTPQFASSLESLNGAIKKLYSDAGSAAEVEINGKIDSYAPVSLKGEINPLLDDMYLDLDFAVSGAELTSVNPYSGTYMGYYIDKGLLSLDVRYQIKDNQLEGNNHVVIDQLTLGRKSDSAQALSLPIGLAVALLQDSDGVIDLGLEVSGELDNPDFSFGSIILNALGNLITKAVTAPFRFLASLVGSEDELNQIAFAAGQATLNEQAMSRLTTLAEALNKRPGLRVSLEGAVDAVNDARELAVAQLHQSLLQRSGLDALPVDLSASTIPLEGALPGALEGLFSERFSSGVEAERERIRTQLQAQADNEQPVAAERVTRALHIAMYNRLRDAMSITEAQLAGLAQQRSKVVKAYLANEAGVDASRLFLLNSRQHLQSESCVVELSLEAD